MKNFFVILLFSIASFAVARWHTSPLINTPIVTAVQEQLNPSFASDGKGGAIIAWQDLRNNGTSNIFAQRVDAFGNIKWAQNGVAICTDVHGQFNPVVVADTSGGAFIVWRDIRNANNLNSAANDTDIYSQHVDNAGKVTWQSNGIPMCIRSSPKSNLIALGDGSNGIISAWVDFRPCLYIYDSIWPQPGSNQYYDSARVCEDEFIPSSVPRVFLQHVDSSGSLWASDSIGVLSCDINHHSSQTYPQLITDGNGGVILVWQDNEATTSAIRCQHFAPDGTFMFPDTSLPVSKYRLAPRRCYYRRCARRATPGVCCRLRSSSPAGFGNSAQCRRAAPLRRPTR